MVLHLALAKPPVIIYDFKTVIKSQIPSMRQVLKYNKNIGDINHPFSSLLGRTTLMFFPDTKIFAVLLKIGYKGFNL